jgi:hypothetical protein
LQEIIKRRDCDAVVKNGETAAPTLSTPVSGYRASKGPAAQTTLLLISRATVMLNCGLHKA